MVFPVPNLLLPWIYHLPKGTTIFKMVVDFQGLRKRLQVKLWFGYSQRLLELQDDLSAEQHLDWGSHRGIEVGSLSQKTFLQPLENPKDQAVSEMGWMEMVIETTISHVFEIWFIIT